MADFELSSDSITQHLQTYSPNGIFREENHHGISENLNPTIQLNNLLKEPFPPLFPLLSRTPLAKKNSWLWREDNDVSRVRLDFRRSLAFGLCSFPSSRERARAWRFPNSSWNSSLALILLR